MSYRIIRGSSRLQKLNVVQGTCRQESDDNDRMESAIQRYDRSVAEMASAHAQVVRDMETRTVELALEISRKIIHRELSTDPEIVAALATIALRRVRSHQQITLRVSPQDFARIRNVVSDINSSIQIEADSSLFTGDLLIDTPEAQLDLRIESQVDTLGRELLAAN